MPIWRLPDNLSDVLPAEARQIEALRHIALNTLRTWGYEIITPPLLENLSALTTGTAQDLEAVIFKVVDPLTGALLGIRADLTPQAARIDAHLLNRTAPTRLCYCAPVLRSQVGDAFAQRELLQLGAELFGHSGLEADIEIQDLILHLLNKLGLDAGMQLTLALSSSAVLQALLEAYPVLNTMKADILSALRTKNKTHLYELQARLTQQYLDDLTNITDAFEALQLLIRSYGTPDEIPSHLFSRWDSISRAVDTLHILAKRAEQQGIHVVIDLADLNGYGYHTGVQFAVYVNGLNNSLVRGGRYDAVGKLFGRSRAATGFSLDLRTLASLLPTQSIAPAILAPWIDCIDLDKAITHLRTQGNTVIRCLPGHEHSQDERLGDRELIKIDGVWTIKPPLPVEMNTLSTVDTIKPTKPNSEVNTIAATHIYHDKKIHFTHLLTSAKKLKDDQALIDRMNADILQKLRRTNSIIEFREYVYRMTKNISKKECDVISFKKADLITLRDFLDSELKKFLIVKESKLIADVALQYRLGNIDEHTVLKIKLDKMTEASISTATNIVPERYGFNTKNSLKVYAFIGVLNEYIDTVK
jgi:ATP phosphoribosyltransferase regulatory subunit